MNEYKVYLPTQGNDKQTIPIKAFKAWEKLCLDNCGGFTKAGNVQGYWQDNKLIYKDKNKVYFVVGELSQIKENLGKVNQYFNQISYFVSLVSSQVEFISM